ncbi:MAG: LysR family transcriptional regulator [Oxalobacter sp.]|nr:MAG: LysR family transcriptional regulator [Oxalobacter sp.]
MDIRQLRYFMAIVEEGQISRAARRLHIAQPPLSLQLKLLEAELGVQLIERNTRSLQPTQAGHALYQRAEQIVSLIDAASKEVREQDGAMRGVLAMGSPPALGSLFMPERIQAFHTHYPEIRFQWREGNTFRILELLDANVIEFGIVRLPVREGAFDMIPLLTEPWVAIVPKKKRLPKSIILSQLAQSPLLLMHRQSGIRAHDMVLDAFASVGLSPVIFCESDNVLALLSLAERDLGIAIMPRSTLRLRPDAFHAMEIADCQLESSVAVIWLRERRLSAAARLFLEMFKPTGTMQTS